MDSQMQEDLIPHLSGGSFVEQGLDGGGLHLSVHLQLLKSC